MGNFLELKNAKNNCTFTDINFRKWDKKYSCDQVFKNVAFLSTSALQQMSPSPQISPC